MRILFSQGSKNQLLINPKLSSEEKSIFWELKQHFEKTYPSENFFLIASSGSSKNANESTKLFALRVDSVLSSAERFNHFFQADSHCRWGIVLPTYHIAGLSILARANKAQAPYFCTEWNPHSIAPWLEQNQISFLSLVPAQVFDLVQRQVKSNEFLKKVFVGAGRMSESLRNDFVKLGWPLVETYGMTETCSMIAVKENDDYFKVLPGIQLRIEDELLQIKCSSTAHSSIQKRDGRIEVRLLEDWIKTDDRVILFEDKLKFLGRSTDYLKISGEGVSLLELRDQLETILSGLKIKGTSVYLQALEDARCENILVLVVDKSLASESVKTIVTEFNQIVRPYEKIRQVVQLNEIPITELGKIKKQELKILVLNQINRGIDGKKI